MGEFDCSRDIWALGCVLLEFGIGTSGCDNDRFFGNKWQHLRKVYNKHNVIIHSDCGGNGSFCDFLDRMFVPDPSKRATARELLKHEFLNEKRPKSRLDYLSVCDFEIGNNCNVKLKHGNVEDYSDQNLPGQIKMILTYIDRPYPTGFSPFTNKSFEKSRIGRQFVSRYAVKVIEDNKKRTNTKNIETDIYSSLSSRKQRKLKMYVYLY